MLSKGDQVGAVEKNKGDPESGGGEKQRQGVIKIGERRKVGIRNRYLPSRKEGNNAL